MVQLVSNLNRNRLDDIEISVHFFYRFQVKTKLNITNIYQIILRERNDVQQLISIFNIFITYPKIL